MAWIGSFKQKRQNLYIAVSPELLIRRISDLRTEFRLWKGHHYSKVQTTCFYNMADGRHLKNRYRHISAVCGSIWIKFGSLMQNNMQITAKWSRSKPEVEFQYGGRLFFQTGSRYTCISAVNWDMSTKFGSLIDFDLLKAVTSTNTKPEVVLSGGGRHLEKSTCVIFSQWVVRFGRNSAAWCRMTCRLRRNGRDRNRKQNSNMANVCFSKQEIVVSRPYSIHKRKPDKFVSILLVRTDDIL